jgi:hypothetical protein
MRVYDIVCVCVCVCVYIHNIHTYIYKYIHMLHSHAFIKTHTTQVLTYVPRSPLNACMLTHTHTHTHAYTDSLVCQVLTNSAHEDPDAYIADIHKRIQSARTQKSGPNTAAESARTWKDGLDACVANTNKGPKPADTRHHSEDTVDQIDTALQQRLNKTNIQHSSAHQFDRSLHQSQQNQAVCPQEIGKALHAVALSRQKRLQDAGNHVNRDEAHRDLDRVCTGMPKSSGNDIHAHDIHADDIHADDIHAHDVHADDIHAGAGEAGSAEKRVPSNCEMTHAKHKYGDNASIDCACASDQSCSSERSRSTAVGCALGHMDENVACVQVRINEDAAAVGGHAHHDGLVETCHSSGSEARVQDYDHEAGIRGADDFPKRFGSSSEVHVHDDCDHTTGCSEGAGVMWDDVTGTMSAFRRAASLVRLVLSADLVLLNK